MLGQSDVVVIGGGIIGTAIAHRLSREGLGVELLESGPLGRQASWAAGGILSAIHPWKYPPALAQLVDTSCRLWPAFARTLEAETGIDLEFRKCGLLMLLEKEDPKELLRWLARYNTVNEHVGRNGALQLEPNLGSNFSDAIHLPEVAQVRNCRVPRALARAAEQSGARIRPHTPALEITESAGRVTGVRIPNGTISTRHVVLAAGAWSSLINRPTATPPFEVKPVKGQMILLEASTDGPNPMILRGDRYLVPRSDGHVLVGSTVEMESGFDTRPTSGAVAELTQEAIDLVPALERATFVRAWAGLRPWTPTRMPLLGPIPEIDGLWVATGHFRNGVGLAPITAEILASLVTGVDPPCDLAPFAIPLHEVGSHS